MNITEKRDINSHYRNWINPYFMYDDINTAIEYSKKEEEQKKAEEEAKKKSRWGKTSGVIDKLFGWTEKGANIVDIFKNGGSAKVDGDTDIVIDPGSGTKTDNTKYIIIGVIILLGVGGGLYYASTKKNKE